MITLKKPVIGLIGQFQKSDQDSIIIHDECRVAILNSGGIPILLLPTYFEPMNKKVPFYNDMTLENEETILPLLELCDGFLFSGGNEWHGFHQFVFQYAYDHDKPVLGICLGMQVMASAPFFHEKYTDKTKQISSSIIHKSSKDYVHEIKILDSQLKKILEKESIWVNSRHSSCVLKHPFFQVSSFSEDGIIESIEIPEKRFMIGVQWHPESLFFQDENSKKLFQAFLESCK